MVLWQPERGALIAGDMGAAIGTIIIEPPDGHMATYIAQLQRLSALEQSEEIMQWINVISADSAC